MANKKTFKNNPALQFISSADENTHNKQYTDNTEQTDNSHNKQYTDITHNTDNKLNEAIAYNTNDAHYTDNTDNAQYEVNNHNKQYTDNKQERKTKRLNLLLQPSILENFGKIAHMKQTSVNDLVNSILKDYVETEVETICMYDKIFFKKH